MWQERYIDEALDDLNSLDKGLKARVIVGIEKVLGNPLPNNEGGYGKPLGNVKGNNLTSFLKIKYKSISIRVVYTLVREEKIINIIVVSERDDNSCYDLAGKRKSKYENNLFKNIFQNKNSQQ
jgi:mRNA interferase RelE/StbE